MSELLSNKKWMIIAAFVFCFSVIVVRVITVPLRDAGKARDSIHGDAYSDINTYSAVQYFYDFGFLQAKFLPFHGYSGNGDLLGVAPYTHYPALPDILAGIYAKILHSEDDQWIRIFPMLLSVVFFFFIFYSLQVLLPNKEAAFVGAMVLVLSNYFIFWADNLHKHLYEEFFKWLFVFLLFVYYRDHRQNKWYLMAAGLIFVAASNVSFEPITYLAVVTIGMSWIFTRKIITYETIFLGVMSIGGVAMHFYQNVVYFNSLELAMADLTNAAALRTVGTDSVQNEMKRNLGWMDFVDIPFMWLRRIERYFLIAGPAFFYLAYLGLKKIRQADVKLFQLGIVLILATLSWNFAMTQHSLVHSFTTRHLGIFYGFVIGYGVLSYGEKIRTEWKEGRWYLKTLHVIFLGYIITMMVSQQFYDYIRYGLFYFAMHN